MRRNDNVPRGHLNSGRGWSLNWRFSTRFTSRTRTEIRARTPTIWKRRNPFARSIGRARLVSFRDNSLSSVGLSVIDRRHSFVSISKQRRILLRGSRNLEARIRIRRTFPLYVVRVLLPRDDLSRSSRRYPASGR